MSAVYDKTWDLPGDQEWADEVLWRNLTAGHPTVLVSEDAELLLLPRPRRLIDRLRGHVVVNVAHRTHGHASPYAIAGRLGRHPVRQMRELAHV
jgi:hypothetical protein